MMQNESEGEAFDDVDPADAKKIIDAWNATPGGSTVTIHARYEEPSPAGRNWTIAGRILIPAWLAIGAIGTVMVRKRIAKSRKDAENDALARRIEAVMAGKPVSASWLRNSTNVIIDVKSLRAAKTKIPTGEQWRRWIRQRS